MKIVYLDQPSYLPEFARERLAALGELTIYQDRPDAAEARKRLSEADIAIVEWTTLSADVLNGLDRLKCIVLVTTAYSFVDTEAARRNGITVCNCPDYSKQSVAEHVFAMFLSLGKRLPAASALAQNSANNYTCHVVGRELYQSTLGIVGFGSIGAWVATIAAGFGMNIVATRRRSFNSSEVRSASLDEVLASSDFVAVCLSVNETSRGLLDSRRLRLLKRDAILVNIASNDVLDEGALAEMLRDGSLFGAGFDETPERDLLSAPNVLVTPGTAWYTQASLDRNVDMFVGTVEVFLAGSSRFVVN
jgi:glycerate dehydrogenase